jgi:hypothetical protein
MNKFIWIITLLVLVFTSCGTNENNSDVIVAKVYDKELYFNEYSYLFDKDDMNEMDSTIISNDYISDWIEEQILVHNAQNNNNVNLIEIENKTERYKNSLIIHKLENDYIEKNIDTNITETELTNYYKNHQNDFQLNDYLVKVLYLKISIDAPDINKLDKWYKLYKESDISEIETYAKLYASNFYYDEENWMYFDELTKEIPLNDINKDKFITQKSKLRLDENGYYYFLNVIDYKLKNTISPLEFEKDNIKQRILNIRIKELRQELKKDNIQKAHDEKSVNIY